MGTGTGVTPTRRGRRPSYLLSGIALCSVCAAPLRVGSQNSGSPDADDYQRRRRYRVYECPGTAGRSGFHVSIGLAHLDEFITGAVLDRIAAANFRVPRASHEDPDGSERRALRLEIKSDREWLQTVHKEAEKQHLPGVFVGQQHILSPKIARAQARIAILEEQDALVLELLEAPSLQHNWNSRTVTQRRQIVRALLSPRIHPVDASRRGQRGLDERRVELVWRGQE